MANLMEVESVPTSPLPSPQGKVDFNHTFCGSKELIIDRLREKYSNGESRLGNCYICQISKSKDRRMDG